MLNWGFGGHDLGGDDSCPPTACEVVPYLDSWSCVASVEQLCGMVGAWAVNARKLSTENCAFD